MDRTYVRIPVNPTVPVAFHRLLQPPSSMQHIVAYLAKDDMLCSPANFVPIAAPSSSRLPPTWLGSRGRAQQHRYPAVRKRQVTWIFKHTSSPCCISSQTMISAPPGGCPRMDVCRGPQVPWSGTLIHARHSQELLWFARSTRGMHPAPVGAQGLPRPTEPHAMHRCRALTFAVVAEVPAVLSGTGFCALLRVVSSPPWMFPDNRGDIRLWMPSTAPGRWGDVKFTAPMPRRVDYAAADTRRTVYVAVKGFAAPFFTHVACPTGRTPGPGGRGQLHRTSATHIRWRGCAFLRNCVCGRARYRHAVVHSRCMSHPVAPPHRGLAQSPRRVENMWRQRQWMRSDCGLSGYASDTRPSMLPMRQRSAFATWCEHHR